MSDFAAGLIVIYFFIALGLGPGCNFKGPGVKILVDGKPHYLKLGGK